ncbi:hypothetical protein B0A50_02386 [Salinomyces thailandicus]|uniref:Uncharacterized protein n=1 Tax=Salinomyces thailandicus TaxID=706561 RepID=A0A4U0U8A7_9PEZI|nr:hypothetical protein B0A50_02386 [Salinomyces thailandica]
MAKHDEGTGAGDGTPPDHSTVILSDEEGGTFPSTIPPAIAFDDFRPRHHSENDSAAEMDSPRPDEEPTSTTGSYFDQQLVAAHKEDRQATRDEGPDRSQPLPFSPIRAPGAKRTNTAPAGGITVARRPGVGPRASTLLGGLKRAATGGQEVDDDRSQLPYTFEPTSTDDSDSSSSDDEAGPEGKTARRSPKKPKDTESTDFANQQQRRRPMQRRRSYTRINMGNEHYQTKGRVSKRDGRLNISINEAANSGYIAKALGQSLKHHLDLPKRHKDDPRPRQEDHEAHRKEESDAESVAEALRKTVTRPRLNIVIMVIGSRGDIQPFLKVGKILKHQYGHRVRIASHPTFRDFVEKDTGLEFFSVGGDPSELMAFMVKNPGLIPNLQTIRQGEIQRRRAAMAVMFEGFWRACVNTTDDEHDSENLKMMGDKSPFIADAIIANPPSMAHVHIAEKLGIPLHMMFTFPYSPTQMFPHPLANIKPSKSNVDANYVNFMSYPLVETMTWQGLGDIVNRFRERTLGLEPVSSLWAPGALYRMKVPYTYMWSPSLVPKPSDWGPEIDIAGFVFLEMASNFEPPKELEDFLNAGDPPIYIGFGSIVVDDPDAFTNMIFEATKKAGVRALVNKGWGGLGGDDREIPAHVHMLGNTPHDWLFPRVKAVVHHGGAGTTAIGLKLAKPTMIVPFFGDQPFWGTMVAEAKAGAHECIPYKRLNADRLADGIKQCLTEEAQHNVQEIADSIAAEGDGAENAVKSFHRSLPLAGRPNMRCSILDDRAAVWQLRGSSLRLSAVAAEILHEKGQIKWSDLKLLRVYEWNDFDGPGEPITGTAGALKDSFYDIGEGVGMVPVRIAKKIRKHEEHERKKREALKRKEDRKAAKAEQKSQPSAKDFADREPQNGGTSEAPGAQSRPQAVSQDTGMTGTSAMSADPADPLFMELGKDAGEGVKKSGMALVSMPNDLLVAIAQGFHNAPRLWGDSTVRKPVRITGFKSGCEAARREFAYGIYDGWTGLVTQPYGDWKDGDTVPAKFAGIGAGLGKGLGGFVVKNVNAVVGPPAFATKGALKYVEKKMGAPEAKPLIRRALIVQGQRDLGALEHQDGKGKKEQLREIDRRVNEGWKIYQELWQEVSKHYGLRKNIFNKVKLKREKHLWEVNGALESVDTAERALKSWREGDDLEKVFAQRRREMSLAEQPRDGAMEQPERYEDNRDVLPNGQKSARKGSSSAKPAKQKDDDDERKINSTFAKDDFEEKKIGTENGNENENVNEGDSERTAVAADDEEGAQRQTSRMEQTKFAGNDGDLLEDIRSASQGVAAG